jgi:hypothetical protein
MAVDDQGWHEISGELQFAVVCLLNSRCRSDKLEEAPNNSNDPVLMSSISSTLWLGHSDARQVSDLPAVNPLNTSVCDLRSKVIDR